LSNNAITLVSDAYLLEMVPADLLYEAKFSKIRQNLSASLLCSIYFASDFWASCHHQILCEDRTLWDIHRATARSKEKKKSCIQQMYC